MARLFLLFFLSVFLNAEDSNYCQGSLNISLVDGEKLFSNYKDAKTVYEIKKTEINQKEYYCKSDELVDKSYVSTDVECVEDDRIADLVFSDWTTNYERMSLKELSAVRAKKNESDVYIKISAEYLNSVKKAELEDNNEISLELYKDEKKINPTVAYLGKLTRTTNTNTSSTNQSTQTQTNTNTTSSNVLATTTITAQVSSLDQSAKIQTNSRWVLIKLAGLEAGDYKLKVDFKIAGCKEYFDNYACNSGMCKGFKKSLDGEFDFKVISIKKDEKKSTSNTFFIDSDNEAIIYIEANENYNFLTAKINNNYLKCNSFIKDVKIIGSFKNYISSKCGRVLKSNKTDNKALYFYSINSKTFFTILNPLASGIYNIDFSIYQNNPSSIEEINKVKSKVYVRPSKLFINATPSHNYSSTEPKLTIFTNENTKNLALTYARLEITDKNGNSFTHFLDSLDGKFTKIESFENNQIQLNLPNLPINSKAKIRLFAHFLDENGKIINDKTICKGFDANITDLKVLNTKDKNNKIYCQVPICVIKHSLFGKKEECVDIEYDYLPSKANSLTLVDFSNKNDVRNIVDMNNNFMLAYRYLNEDMLNTNRTESNKINVKIEEKKSYKNYANSIETARNNEENIEFATLTKYKDSSSENVVSIANFISKNLNKSFNLYINPEYCESFSSTKKDGYEVEVKNFKNKLWELDNIYYAIPKIIGEKKAILQNVNPQTLYADSSKCVKILKGSDNIFYNINGDEIKNIKNKNFINLNEEIQLTYENIFDYKLFRLPSTYFNAAVMIKDANSKAKIQKSINAKVKFRINDKSLENTFTFTPVGIYIPNLDCKIGECIIFDTRTLKDQNNNFLIGYYSGKDAKSLIDCNDKNSGEPCFDLSTDYYDVIKNPENFTPTNPAYKVKLINEKMKITNVKNQNTIRMNFTCNNLCLPLSGQGDKRVFDVNPKDKLQPQANTIQPQATSLTIQPQENSQTQPQKILPKKWPKIPVPSR